MLKKTKLLCLMLVLSLLVGLFAACMVKDEAVDEKGMESADTANESTQQEDSQETEDSQEAENSETTELNFPTKPIKLVVPWPAGGSTDVVARMLSSVAEEHFGQPVVVENIEGGAGTIGTQEVAIDDADGYTVLVAAIAPTILQPYYKDLQYTPQSFVSLGQISARDVVIAVKGDAEWNTLEELIAYGSSEAGLLTYAVASGVHNQLLFALLAKEAGFSPKLFPVQGDAPSVTAVLGGTADVSVVSSISAVKSQIDSGEMKALAIFSEERSELLPDVPTVKELEYDLVGNPWTGLLVAKDTPAEIVEYLEKTFKTVIEDQAFIDNMKQANASINYLSADEFDAKIIKEYEEFGVVIKELGLDKDSQ